MPRRLSRLAVLQFQYSCYTSTKFNKNKQFERIKVEAQEKNGTVFASEKMIQDLKKENTGDKKAREQRKISANTKRSDKAKYCEKKRRKLAEIESYMEVHHTLLDEQKTKALHKLIKQECR